MNHDEFEDEFEDDLGLSGIGSRSNWKSETWADPLADNLGYTDFGFFLLPDFLLLDFLISDFVLSDFFTSGLLPVNPPRPENWIGFLVMLPGNLSLLLLVMAGLSVWMLSEQLELPLGLLAVEHVGVVCIESTSVFLLLLLTLSPLSSKREMCRFGAFVNENLKQKWSINTNIIECLYSQFSEAAWYQSLQPFEFENFSKGNYKLMNSEHSSSNLNEKLKWEMRLFGSKDHSKIWFTAWTKNRPRIYHTVWPIFQSSSEKFQGCSPQESYHSIW